MQIEQMKKENIYINRIFANKVDHPKYFGVSIYYSGCDVNEYFGKYCKECHNPETWIKENGKQMTIEKVLEFIISKLDFLFESASHDKLSLNYVGGEPLTKYHRKSVLYISKYIKEKYDDKVVQLLYSWRDKTVLKKSNLLHYLNYIDEFVLGKFEIEKKVDDFPASLNQQYITRETLLK